MKNELPYKSGVVLGYGPREAKIALVGEQPAINELRRGKPFVGNSGEELDKCLHDVGIVRSQLFITNVIKDMHLPLSSYIKFSTKGEATVSDLGRQYIEYLKEELEYVKPNVVVPLGNVALYALASRTGITKWRGSIIESTLIPGLKVVPTFHPSSILPKKGSYSGGKYLNKHLITFDLLRALEQSETPEIKEPNVIIKTAPTFNEAVEFLHECKNYNILDFDIETSRVTQELLCFAFTLPSDPYNPPTSMCIPLTEKGDYFTIEQEAEILKLLAQILEDPTISIAGQNISFDIWFMLRKYGIVTKGVLHDTMIAQKICLPDYPAGLDFICSMHTDFPYYKDDGKKWMVSVNASEEFWIYNSRDTLSTNIARSKQLHDLHSQGNIEAYNERCKLLYPLIYMQEKGIRIDVDGMLSQRTEVTNSIKEMEEELWSIVGYQINYNSPKQMMRYFYEEKGHKPYQKWSGAKKQYVSTCDDKALVRLSRKGFREAGIVGKLRTLSTKHLGTYLSLDKVDTDGRYRSSYNPVGARTGRLSSGENIFGTGGNQQNWPDSLLKFMIADPGYILYSLDLSQAENRIVAYIGKIIELIEIFESGRDAHKWMAGIIFNKHEDDVTTEPGTCPLGDGTHPERFWGKKGNHAVNYDIGVKEFALTNEITEKEAKTILTAIHNGCPGIREGYQATIKAMLRDNRTLVTPFGDSRLFMEKWPEGKRGDLFKSAYAHIPQNTVGRKINTQGINYVYYNQDKFAEAELLRQVHDDLGMQFPISAGFKRHAEMLWDLKQSLETPLIWNDRTFTIPVDITMGLTFCKKDSIEISHKKFPTNVNELADKLEHSYQELLNNSIG